MIRKLFSYIIFCVLTLCPIAIANSQPTASAGKVEKVKLSPTEKAKLLRELHQKETENRNLKIKIKVNERKINELLGQLIETKSLKRDPIYKRIFTPRNRKKVLPEVVKDPVPVNNNIDTGLVNINQVDTIAPIVPVPPKRENFFRRIFKIFKHKK